MAETWRKVGLARFPVFAKKLFAEKIKAANISLDWGEKKILLVRNELELRGGIFIGHLLSLAQTAMKR